MNTGIRLTANGIFLAMFCISTQCDAGLILNPGTILASTIPPLNGNYTLSSGLDQSGLSAGYTSGVTDFDSYVASNPSHVHSGLNTHFLSNGVTSGNIDFDLGDMFAVERVAIWNWSTSQGGVGLRQVEVFTSSDSAFTSPRL